MIAAFQEKFRKFKRSYLQAAGILLLVLLALFLLWFNKTNSNQAINAIAAQVRFEGEYRIGDGPWQTIVEGQHISATQGDVTLRGNFHMLTPDGEYVGRYSGDTPIAFYADHLNLTVREGENEPFIFSAEYPLLGESFCGAYWEAFAFTEGNEAPIELAIHNPHRFGNETAVDELLASFAFWGGLDFEKGALASGQTQRNTGLFFVIVAFVLLGSALFSALLHI